MATEVNFPCFLNPFQKELTDLFLKKISLLRENVENFHTYPFSIPAIQNLGELNITNSVTFFVGENGSGKSTLLEAVADKCGFNTAGGSRNHFYDVYQGDSVLGDFIRLSWLPKVTDGFFLRAESFYQFATHMDEVEKEDPTGFQGYGGSSLHQQSHGESFLSLFANRFRKKAIYLLDEPEAALSPQRQLSFLKILHDLTADGDCQFIIATHSPILLGYPEGVILSFDDGKISEMEYEMTDHYKITKYFLQHREKFLRDILRD